MTLQADGSFTYKPKRNFRGALQRAVKKRLIPYNVARDAEPHHVDQRRRGLPPLGQVANFLKAAAWAESRLAALCIVAALVGP